MHFTRLRDLREDMDLKQSEMAEIIGTSQSYYAQYENGKRSIPFERIIELSKFYKVSIDYIAGLTNDKGGLHKLKSDEQKILDIFNGLSERSKGKLELYAEQLQEAEVQMKEIG